MKKLIYRIDAIDLVQISHLLDSSEVIKLELLLYADDGNYLEICQEYKNELGIRLLNVMDSF